MPHWASWCLYLPLLPLCQVLAYDPLPRWGQASVVLNDALFVFGGKTDQFNSYSYTSAPDTNDLLYLDLSSPFNGASPPWQLVSSSTNSSTSQGPALSWHTLSAFDASEVLLFGGEPGPNSNIVVTTAADSAEILNVSNYLEPTWITEPPTWAGEPSRRKRHSTATSPSGSVFIIGGEKADGSGLAFSDHAVFNPMALTFTPLPTANAPPDIYGHASIILSDGRLLVFGGFSQTKGALLPLSTIWILDTTLTWNVATTATNNFPPPRMAFAAVLIDNGRILIHGGSDASLQTNFGDGWLLDTTQNPMIWTPLPILSQLGARRDHFAVSALGQVIFCFGYSNGGPAPAAPLIYEPDSGTFVPSYTPQPVAGRPAPTIPTLSQTATTRRPSTTKSGTSTAYPNNPGGANNNSSTTAIALGTTFGVLGLVAVGLGVAYYVRHQRGRQHERRFLDLNEEYSDDGGSPRLENSIPAVNMREDPGRPSLLASLGISAAFGVSGAKTRVVRNPQERRDMLADEDARSFGEWYEARRRDGSGVSSWSLRNILGGSGPRLRSREGSMTSHHTGGRAEWREKMDPFSDAPATPQNEEPGFISTAAPGSRPAHWRERSYGKNTRNYRDPFADPIIEEERRDVVPSELPNSYYDKGPEPNRPSIRHVTGLSPITTVLPLSQYGGHSLSPLTEHASQNTLLLQDFNSGISSPAHSSEHAALSPFDGHSMSRVTSRTSVDLPLSPHSPVLKPARSSSIINAQPMPDPSVKRSDSWWGKLSRTNLLDRKSSDASRRQIGFDIRDPNPPPKLGVIEERSMGSVPGTDKISPDSSAGLARPSPAKSTLSRAGSRVYDARHAKSVSSVRTVDSEAIERMAGAMDVVQRFNTRSHHTSGSTSSVGGLSVDTHVSGFSLDAGNQYGVGEAGDLMVFASPADIDIDIDDVTPKSITIPALAMDPSIPSTYPPRTLSPPPAAQFGIPNDYPDRSTSPLKHSSNVASRIHAYERRLSQDQPDSPPPTNTKYREERTKKRVNVDYGLVPRPNLFITNPDHRSSGTGSGDSRP